jgi:hypothetical protein
MRTQLSFEAKETKELLSKLDFRFFIDQNIHEEKYADEEVRKLWEVHTRKLRELKRTYRKQKRQANYYLEGQVRKMFTGGFLPALFHLDETRQHIITDLEGIGEDMAYFVLWQKYYRRKVTAAKVWDVVMKTGSILAIILSVMKVYETIHH